MNEQGKKAEWSGDLFPASTPPHGRPVLLFMRSVHNGREFAVRARFVRRFTEQADPNYDDACDYHKGTDEYYWREGWYEDCLTSDEYSCYALSPHDFEPVAWSELPRLPMEMEMAK